jgi:hypothetical protein
LDGVHGILAAVSVAGQYLLFGPDVVVPLHEDGRLEHLSEEIVAGLEVFRNPFLLLVDGSAASPCAEIEAVAEVDADRGLPASDEGA